MLMWFGKTHRQHGISILIYIASIGHSSLFKKNVNDYLWLGRWKLPPTLIYREWAGFKTGHIIKLESCSKLLCGFNQSDMCKKQFRVIKSVLMQFYKKGGETF